jgi:hypothetical protein
MEKFEPIAAVRQAGGAASAAKLRGIGACAIVGANNYQSLRLLAEFTILDLIDRRRSHDTDGRIQFLDALDYRRISRSGARRAISTCL